MTKQAAETTHEAPIQSGNIIRNEAQGIRILLLFVL